MKISVKAITRSSQNKLVELEDGSYKVYVNTPPVDGAANKKICEVIAKYFKVSKGKVEVSKGQTSNHKIISIALMVLALSFSSLYSYQPKVNYFIQISGTGVVTDGDMDGKTTITGVDDDGREETSYIPLVDNYFGDKLFLGAHVNAHNVIFALGYLPMKTEWINTNDSIAIIEKGDMSWLLFGFEYRYNFLWPDPLRAYIGLGYDFERFSLDENSNDIRGKVQGSIITGRGFHASFGGVWMFHEHLGLDLGVTLGFLNYENLSTDDLGFSELDGQLKQIKFEMLLGFRVQF